MAKETKMFIKPKGANLSLKFAKIKLREKTTCGRPKIKVKKKDKTKEHHQPEKKINLTRRCMNIGSTNVKVKTLLVGFNHRLEASDKKVPAHI